MQLSRSHPVAGSDVCVSALGHAEIPKLDLPGRGEEHIGRIDVAVHEAKWVAGAGLRLVKVGESLEDLEDDVNRHLEGKSLSAAPQCLHQGAKVTAHQEFDRDEGSAERLADFQSLDQIRVREQAHQIRLVVKRLQRGALAHQLEGNLDLLAAL